MTSPSAYYPEVIDESIWRKLATALNLTDELRDQAEEALGAYAVDIVHELATSVTVGEVTRRITELETALGLTSRILSALSNNDPVSKAVLNLVKDGLYAYGVRERKPKKSYIRNIEEHHALEIIRMIKDPANLSKMTVMVAAAHEGAQMALQRQADSGGQSSRDALKTCLIELGRVYRRAGGNVTAGSHDYQSAFAKFAFGLLSAQKHAEVQRLADGPKADRAGVLPRQTLSKIGNILRNHVI